jgi:site-specific DNA recombinase
MNNLQGKKAILYRRVSTTDQKEFGNSLNAQQGSLRDFCEKNSMTISKEFQEDCSAKNFNRPEWQNLYKFAKKTKIKLIIYYWSIGIGFQGIHLKD